MLENFENNEMNYELHNHQAEFNHQQNCQDNQRNESLIRFEHEEAKAKMEKAAIRLFLWFPFGIYQYVKAKRRLKEATEQLREFLQNQG
ncbi:MAG: hypothetical protein FWE03_01130 [Firmicutes bacterium]|nr:hypothetical protein [Bacillota bacterium]